MTYNVAGATTYTLGSSIGSTDTTILLSSFLEPVTGTPYTMALLNTSIVYATIAPKTTSSEFISFSGITQNTNGTATLTGVVRGLARKYPFATDSAYKLPHAGQSQFILSDAPQVFNKKGTLENDEVITGLWEAPNPTTAQGLVPRDYMLNLINGGTISVNNVVVAGVAGETISQGNLVYLKVADGRWWKTDADTAGTVDNVQLGIAQGAGTAGVTITGGVLVEGVDTHNTGTTGALVYASNTAGALSTSTGTTERVVGQYMASLAGLYFNPNFYYTLTALQKAQIPSAGEKQALAGGGAFGTPSTSNKYITQDYNASSTGLPVVRTYTLTSVGSSTTQFDITNPAGTTFRYTYDGTGTNPNISAATFPIGATVSMYSPNGPNTWNVNNMGVFTVTGSGTNYFEVTNAAGVALNNVTIGPSGGYLKVAANTAWSKPAGLKYVVVEGVSGGGGGGGSTTTNRGCGGGGSGAYGKRTIAAASLGSTETIAVGGGGRGGLDTGGTGQTGGTTSFGSLLSMTGGVGGTNAVFGVGGVGGTSTNGDINSTGNSGGYGSFIAGLTVGGNGGNSYFGGGAPLLQTGSGDTPGLIATTYGGGGGGAALQTGGDTAGGFAYEGILIVTEYYS